MHRYSPLPHSTNCHMKANVTLEHCGLTRRTRLKAFIVLSIYMIVTVFLVTLDNPWLRSPFGGLGHIDSAMFFMGGKAWANGLTPYVDFTDSKGPLLWLMHLVAYLISHDSYLGIMILLAVVMSFAIYFSWLTAVRILGNARVAFWAAAPMPIMWFLCLNFMDTRVETFAQLPMAYLFYVMVCGMRSPTLLSRSMAFWSGVSLMSMLLIKWNLVAFGGLIVLGQVLICFNYDKSLIYRYLWGGYAEWL